MTNAMLAVVTASMLAAGCGEQPETPVVKACLAATATRTTATASLRRCRCADRLARRQLDSGAYRLLTELSEASVSKAPVSSRTGEAAFALADFQKQAGTVDRAIAVADLALVTAKAATRCTSA